MICFYSLQGVYLLDQTSLFGYQPGSFLFQLVTSAVIGLILLYIRLLCLYAGLYPPFPLRDGVVVHILILSLVCSRLACGSQLFVFGLCLFFRQVGQFLTDFIESAVYIGQSVLESGEVTVRRG